MPKIIGLHGDAKKLTATRETGETIWCAPYRDAAAHLLSLPRDALCFAFDTMQIATRTFEGISDPFDLYMTFHPETRRRYFCLQCKRKWITQRAHCPSCQSTEISVRTPLHRVRGEYGLIRGYTADRDGFTVAEGPPKRWAQSRRVWSAMGFTHKGLEESLESFDIREKDKALATALLMRRVLTTLSDAGIDIKGQYRGAGSSAGTLMRKHNVAAYRGPSQSDIAETSPDLAHAIMSAYFGGREEIAVQGEVKGPLWEYDLSNAYATALIDAPCLKCGVWWRVTQGTRELETAAVALVRFSVNSAWEMCWAPLPCRTEGGPVYGTGFVGYAWYPEVFTAIEKWPGLIEILDGWAYRTSCKHRPFAWLSQTLRQRCALEKKGQRGAAGLLKASAVGAYGKVAQRFASPLQSYIWAGAATSLVRSTMLHVLGAHGRDITSVATDAVVSRSRLPLALGPDAWKEEKLGSVFFAAPGVYADNDTAEGKKIIAAVKRGSKSATLREEAFVDGRAGTTAMIRCGKCGLTWDFVGGWHCPECKIVGGVPKAAKARRYGQTITRMREVSLEPHPMRDYETSILSRKCRRLRVRDLGGVVSLPYEPRHQRS